MYWVFTALFLCCGWRRREQIPYYVKLFINGRVCINSYVCGIWRLTRKRTMKTDESPSYKEQFCSNCSKFRPLTTGWETTVSQNGKVKRKICPDCVEKTKNFKSQ